jgi:hypothetical protein
MLAATRHASIAAKIQMLAVARVQQAAAVQDLHHD